MSVWCGVDRYSPINAKPPPSYALRDAIRLLMAHHLEAFVIVFQPDTV
jgi:hypothetical protein